MRGDYRIQGLSARIETLAVRSEGEGADAELEEACRRKEEIRRFRIGAFYRYRESGCWRSCGKFGISIASSLSADPVLPWIGGYRY